MQELVKQLMEKANLNEEQAHKALEVITDYIKGQVPPMMQPMIDNFINAGGANNADDIAG